MLELIDESDSSAPFIKHFCKEEWEIRALLSMKKTNKNVQKLGKYEDGSYYFDLSIDEKCIKKMIGSGIRLMKKQKIRRIKWNGFTRQIA